MKAKTANEFKAVWREHLSSILSLGNNFEGEEMVETYAHLSNIKADLLKIVDKAANLAFPTPFQIGSVAEDYDGESYEILAISQDYRDVSQYDSTGAGKEVLDMENDLKLEEQETKNLWYAGVSAVDDTQYVFGITEGSDILGQ